MHGSPPLKRTDLLETVAWRKAPISRNRTQLAGRESTKPHPVWRPSLAETERSFAWRPATARQHTRKSHER